MRTEKPAGVGRNLVIRLSELLDRANRLGKSVVCGAVSNVEGVILEEMSIVQLGGWLFGGLGTAVVVYIAGRLAVRVPGISNIINKGRKFKVLNRTTKVILLGGEEGDADVVTTYKLISLVDDLDRMPISRWVSQGTMSEPVVKGGRIRKGDDASGKLSDVVFDSIKKKNEVFSFELKFKIKGEFKLPREYWSEEFFTVPESAEIIICFPEERIFKSYHAFYREADGTKIPVLGTTISDSEVGFRALILSLRRPIPKVNYTIEWDW